VALVDRRRGDLGQSRDADRQLQSAFLRRIARHLGRSIKLRSAGLTTLRILGHSGIGETLSWIASRR
jgi:hypothetical protein